MKKKRRRGGVLSLIPIYVWTVVMVLFPLGYIFILSFLTRGEMFGVVWEFSLENYSRIFSPMYLDIFLNSGKVAVITTVLTFAIGYPFAYAMSLRPARQRSLLMMLVIIPFWTSALLRTYGWMILLRNKGLINNLLIWLGIISEPIKMLNTQGAVITGMVYSLLPFMILPIYTSIEKLDTSVREAARDLGANKLRAFLTVTLPLTLPGIMSGCMLVFVPSVGMFFISDLLGGGTTMLLGNLINNQLTTSRDWPFGAALSMIMVVLTFLTMSVYRRFTRGDMGVF